MRRRSCPRNGVPGREQQRPRPGGGQELDMFRHQRGVSLAGERRAATAGARPASGPPPHLQHGPAGLCSGLRLPSHRTQPRLHRPCLPPPPPPLSRGDGVPRPHHVREQALPGAQFAPSRRAHPTPLRPSLRQPPAPPPVSVFKLRCTNHATLVFPSSGRLK